MATLGRLDEPKSYTSNASEIIRNPRQRRKSMSSRADVQGADLVHVLRGEITSFLDSGGFGLSTFTQPLHLLISRCLTVRTSAYAFLRHLTTPKQPNLNPGSATPGGQGVPASPGMPHTGAQVGNERYHLVPCRWVNAGGRNLAQDCRRGSALSSLSISRMTHSTR